VLVVVFAALTSHAQYFGQNKVRHESFDFKVLHTHHDDGWHQVRPACQQLLLDRRSPANDRDERTNTALPKNRARSLEQRAQPTIQPINQAHWPPSPLSQIICRQEYTGAVVEAVTAAW